MKVAVTFSGQPRVDNDVIVNHRKNLLADDMRVYSHCWWDPSHVGKAVTFHSTEKFEIDDMYQSFVNHYNPHISHAENYRDIDITFCKSHDYSTWAGCSQKHYDIFTPSCLYSQISQKTSVDESVSMAAGDGADFIIRMRSDVYLRKDLKDMASQLSQDKNVVYVQSSMDGGHLYAGEFPNRPCDWFYCGSASAMSKFTSHSIELLKIACENGVKHVNELLTMTAHSAGLQLKLLDFGALIARQIRQNNNRRDISLYYDEFDSDHLRITHNHDCWPAWHEKVDFHFLRRQGL